MTTAEVREECSSIEINKIFKFNVKIIVSLPNTITVNCNKETILLFIVIGSRRDSAA